MIRLNLRTFLQENGNIHTTGFWNASFADDWIWKEPLFDLKKYKNILIKYKDLTYKQSLFLNEVVDKIKSIEKSLKS